MFEWGFVVGCSVLASALAFGLVRVCLRDIWDGIAAVALFIPGFLLGGESISRHIEGALRETELGLSGTCVVFTATLMAAAFLFGLTCILVGTVRRAGPRWVSRGGAA